ncbi:SapC family protein [Sphingomonas echinoides]|uniref:SapC family protein n=1 Tax=Sphingomonas echinoides TaxID=59803 RepID=A0ABU4PJL9_9SPHN|nr:SapC family protein [Sphingomonas echinoides]MDX5984388.1 SapC family protein [Sphingomonas echinoides]
MTDHVLVTIDDHRATRIDRGRSAVLGDAVQLCLIVPDEFRSVQNAYPILFQRTAARDGFQAVALFGFAPEENLYLEGDRWDAPYLPLAMATRPFLIGPPPEGGDVPQLHLDAASPRVLAPGNAGYDAASPLFDDAGALSAYLAAVLEGLGRLDRGYRAAPDFFVTLERHDLLEPVSIRFDDAEGNARQIVDFHGIDEERFAALDGSALGELHRDGHLLPITMALASLANIAPLIARHQRRSHG